MSTYLTPYLHEDWIQKDALDIVGRLIKKKHTCYLVGGCVRDLLIGIHPKDFDIATTATPQEVKRAVPYSYIIGKRFRLVLVKRGEHQFEVATFRKNNNLDSAADDESFEENENITETRDTKPPIPFGDNVFGTPEEDALRRDFTINGLFYNPFSHEIVDYVDGMKDLKNYSIKMIGEPDLRLIEDPIRILRAVRLAHKINFSIDEPLFKSIKKNAHTLQTASLPRKREEFLKFLKIDNPALVLTSCFDLNILEYLSPTLFQLFQDHEKRSVFLSQLENFHNYRVDASQPLHLMILFVYIYIGTEYSDIDIKELTVNKLYENEAINHFFRFEIGVFKLELEIAFKTIVNIKKLQNIEKFKSTTSKKLFQMIKSDHFYISLLISIQDKHLKPKALQFWVDKYLNPLTKQETVVSQSKSG